jgi:hypothetical protein
MLPLSMQTYEPRHKQAKLWARIEERAYPP